MAASMTDEEFDAFLDSRPGWITLSTIDQRGYPHSVPIGYFRVDDTVLIGCRDNTQKIRNIERNPRVSLMVESGSTMNDIKGAMIQGTARVIRDPAGVLDAMRKGAARRGVPESEWPTEARPGAAYIEVRIDRRISWDYSKSG